jgi:gliding motility-associated-like protein
VSGNGTIVSPNDPFTVIADLAEGENIFTWTVDNGACGSTTDEVSIFLFDGTQQPADAGPDQSFCQDTTFTTLAAVPVTGTANGTWSVLVGSVNFADPNDPATAITDVAEGTNYLLWTVDNGACGVTVDTMIVDRKDCDNIIIPDAFSPNSDGRNDNLVIPGITYYPENHLIIFNRWGSKVLDRRNYQNDWDGRSENSLNWGEQLPEGAYYYILELGNDSDAYTGYIYLRR